MKYILRILISALVVVLLAKVLPGAWVNNYLTAILVALAISVLNVLVKPILILLTLPVTIVTLGLFLLVINALIIILADLLVPGFQVDGFGWALIFSLLLSLMQYVLFSWIKE